MSFLAHNIDIEYNGKKYHLDSADVLFGHKKELRGMPETWVKKIGSIGSVDYDDYPFKSIELFVVTRDSSSVNKDTMLAVIKPQPRKGFRYSLAYINGKERLSQLLKDLKVSDSRRVNDSNSEYVQCENSNLRFHGTKLDRNGNECAVFSTPNHNTFSIQRNSLWGTQSWNTGSKSTMDAETFLAKNPKVTLESLERAVIKSANETNAAWGKNIRVHNKQILDSKIKDDDSSQKGLIEDFSSWASAERCPLTPYHFKGFRENDPSFNSNAAFDIIDELVKWNGFILEDLNDLVVAKFDTHDNAAVEECCEDIKLRVGNALSRVDRYFNDKNYIVQLYIKALERAHRLAVNELKSLNTVSDSKKIKDANDTPDVLDGVLFIGFTDGTEDDMIAEVSKHKNESGEIGGVQYETYETDSSDGVAMIDLCAATDDANAFVKALLKEWGIAKNVADLEFEASDEMKEAVSDSRKRVRDERVVNKSNRKQYKGDPNDYSEYEGCDFVITKSVRGSFESDTDDFTKNTYIAEIYPNFYVGKKDFWQKNVFPVLKDKFGYVTILTNGDVVVGVELINDRGITENNVMDVIDEFIAICENDPDVSQVNSFLKRSYREPIKANINDSRVNDMTKPIRWKAYAERVRAKRQNKNEENENEPENEKQDVADSRRVRDMVSPRHFSKGNTNDSDYCPYVVFEDGEFVEEFYLDFDAIDFAEVLASRNGGALVEVVKCEDTGVCEETVWSSDWDDERDSWGVL